MMETIELVVAILNQYKRGDNTIKITHGQLISFVCLLISNISQQHYARMSYQWHGLITKYRHFLVVSHEKTGHHGRPNFGGFI